MNNAAQQVLIPENIVCKIILKDGTYFDVTEQLAEMYQKGYPKLDVYDQLNRIAMWNFSATYKDQKTRKGIKKHINGWLARQRPEQPLQHTSSEPLAIVSTRSQSLVDDLCDRSWAME